MNIFYKGGRGLRLLQSDQPNYPTKETTRLKGLWPTVYSLQLKIKSLKPIAYSILLLNFMLFSVSGAWAQSAESRAAEGQSSIRPLQIGDTIPDEFWDMPVQIVNHASEKEVTTLGIFRGKMLILDFLSTGCSSCMQAVSRLNQIKKDVLDDVHILLITSERAERIHSFNQNNSVFKENKLHIIINDTYLKLLFPHVSISHLVWIDEFGKIGAITGSDHAQLFTVLEFLNGDVEGWPRKIENNDFGSQSLIGLNAGANITPHNTKRMLAYAVLTGYTEGIANYQPTSIDSIQGIKVISFRNRSILDLYQIAVNQLFKLDSEQIRLEVSDTERYDLRFADLSSLTKESWFRKYAYCYERTVDLNMADKDWRSLMLDDLNRFLNLQGSLGRDGQGNEYLLIKEK